MKKIVRFEALSILVPLVVFMVSRMLGASRREAVFNVVLTALAIFAVTAVIVAKSYRSGKVSATVLALFASATVSVSVALLAAVLFSMTFQVYAALGFIAICMAHFSGLISCAYASKIGAQKLHVSISLLGEALAMGFAIYCF